MRRLTLKVTISDNRRRSLKRLSLALSLAEYVEEAERQGFLLVIYEMGLRDENPNSKRV